MLNKTARSWLFAIASMLAVCGVSVAADKPNVVILATGGTIAGAGADVTNSATYQAAKVPVDKLIAGIPQLNAIASVRGEQVFQIASESLTNANLVTLAKRVAALVKQNDVDGVVITHGTDRLQFTGERLVERLGERPAKPVVLTGAMRPYELRTTDALQNLTEALLAVQLVAPGVYVAMHNQVLRFPGVVKDVERLRFTQREA